MFCKVARDELLAVPVVRNDVLPTTHPRVVCIDILRQPDYKSCVSMHLRRVRCKGHTAHGLEER